MANFQSCISIITMPQPWSHKAPPPLLFSSTASEFSRFTNRLCQCGDAATMSTLGKCRQIDPKFQRTECYKWNPFWRNQTKQMYAYFEGFHYWVVLCFLYSRMVSYPCRLLFTVIGLISSLIFPLSWISRHTKVTYTHIYYINVCI